MGTTRARRHRPTTDDRVTVMDTTGFQQQFDGDPVLTWRAQQLNHAGFTESQAAWLAICPTVDLHYAIDLLRDGLKAGSTPEVIFDVLAE